MKTILNDESGRFSIPLYRFRRPNSWFYEIIIFLDTKRTTHYDKQKKW